MFMRRDFMKNKGFTLIELLAVIVILAIIALIAAPIVLNIIDSSKEQSIQRSIDLYKKAVENGFVSYQLEHGEPSNGIYTGIKTLISQDGKTVIDLEYDGGYEVFCNNIMYDNGELTVDSCTNESFIASTNGELQNKVNDAEDGSVLVLEADYREQIVVPYGKTLTIDLNGYTVYGPSLKESWVGTISNYGTLTIKGNGTVTETAGGYVILNHGTMTIEGGTYRTADVDSKSSVIENGYRDPSKYKEGEESEFPHLTMNGGTVIGGVANIKNDSNGTLVVNKAAFMNDDSVNILNWNTATINGGTFKVTDGKKTNINNAPSGTSRVDSGFVTINGGQFNSDYVVMGLSQTGYFTFNNGTYTGELINPNSVTENYICWPVTEATTGNIPSGNYDIGDEYTCTVGNQTATENLKFFVLDKQGDNIYLIMDRNISKNHMPENVAWITKEHFLEAGGSEDVWTSNGNITQYGPISAMASLKEKTVQWNKIVEENIVLPTKDQIYNVNNST
ncbi:MAG: prepilin-type N-terminal cleavage/methylation domain-containing protein, partial [Bacilli bacterium]|nr:prepilin-type N-terminal cleavage/methylation domain-containing protein [Bacilli bacterium]